MRLVHATHAIGQRAGQCDRCLASIREQAILAPCPYARPTIGAMTKKRGYSRDFTPRTSRRLAFMADKVPATLHEAVISKVKRQGTSVRTVILTLLEQWTKEP